VLFCYQHTMILLARLFLQHTILARLLRITIALTVVKSINISDVGGSNKIAKK